METITKNLALLRTFSFEGKEQKVSFVETIHVADGVDCDVYIFPGDKSKDLGIIKIKPSKKTPLQKVLKGDRTIEAYVYGRGKLIVTRPDGEKVPYEVGGDSSKPLSVTINIGELMQWQAAQESELVASEVCFPPYVLGRYEDIPE
jgi:hypothetical protein